jgi:hypothetical protein
MPDEDVVIEGLHGPYAGQRLTVSAADAKQAIADGWARDPFAEPEDAKEMTDEERAKVIAAAEKAGRKLRGEPEEDNGNKEKKPAAKDKSMEADKPSATYETRSAPVKSK